MPANLSHAYLNAEKKFRQASTLDEELQCLELMLREIPKHKGTDKLQADLKRRISQTRQKIQNASGRKTSPGFRIPRQGAARVVLIGGPNSGKTCLFNHLAHADQPVADYPFTTVDPHPALMPLAELQVQLIDTPPILATELDPRTGSLVRGADLVLLLCGLDDDHAADDLSHGLDCLQTSRTRLARESSWSETDIGVTFTQALLVWTKIDQQDARVRREIFAEYLSDHLPAGLLPGIEVSATRGEGLERLRETMFQRLDLIRVYTRHPSDKTIERIDPWGLPRGATVMDLAAEVHEDLARHFSQARIWGEGKHDGTVVAGDYVLEDQDVVEIRTR